MNENDTHNPFNFSDILDRNHKKNEKTPVSNLIRSTTQEVMPVAKIEETQNFDDTRINEKIDRLEGLVQSIIINQQTIQTNTANQLTLQKEQLSQEERKEPIVEEKKDFSILYKMAVLTILLAIFATSLLMLKRSQTKEVKKVSAPIAIKKSQTYYLTKYVNLRMKPSTSALKLMTLPQNGMITLGEKVKGWTKITYKDHVLGKTFTGWIWGQNFKKVH